YDLASLRSIRRESAWFYTSRQARGLDGAVCGHHEDSGNGHSQNALRDDRDRRKHRLRSEIGARKANCSARLRVVLVQKVRSPVSKTYNMNATEGRDYSRPFNLFSI